jgi:hypothetical protein
MRPSSRQYAVFQEKGVIKTYQSAPLRVAGVFDYSNATNNKEENGHSRSTSHQHRPSAHLVDDEPGSDEADKTRDVAQNVEQEGLALVPFRLIEHNRVLTGECLAGDLLAKHGNHSNHGTLSVVFVENLCP